MNISSSTRNLASKCSLHNSYTIQQISNVHNYGKDRFPECPLERVTNSSLAAYLDTDLLISLTDGRILNGRLKGTDRSLNLIIDHTQELLQGDTRSIGMVVVPSQYIASIKRHTERMIEHDVL